MGIAEKTVKTHRGQAMRKLEVGSVPELLRIVNGLHPVHADTLASYQAPAQWSPSIDTVLSMRSGETVPVRSQISDRDRAPPLRDDRRPGP
jgi:hypothetical protein